jgi:4'-phosphopantetheinyl transferase
VSTERQLVRLGEVVIGWAGTSPNDGAAVPLGPADTARAATMTVQRRTRFVQGRALLHHLLDELRPDAVPHLDAGRCPDCGVAHGPVEVADHSAVASLSYAEHLVVAAVASPDRVIALGLDAEHDSATAERRRDLTHLIGGTPASALRRWTQTEAVLKADGRGLRVDPARVHLHGNSARIDDSSAHYQLAEVAGPAGYLISVAWRGAQRGNPHQTQRRQPEQS